MTVKAAAERLEISPSLVYALCAAGKLRCHRIGLGRGCIRIDEEQLADFLGKSVPVRQPEWSSVGTPDEASGYGGVT
jgi:excisionase family DNA binding protein